MEEKKEGEGGVQPTPTPAKGSGAFDEPGRFKTGALAPLEGMRSPIPWKPRHGLGRSGRNNFLRRARGQHFRRQFLFPDCISNVATVSSRSNQAWMHTTTAYNVSTNCIKKQIVV